VFVAWCSEHKIDPLRTSVPQLAQFLEHLGLAPITLEGYRTVITGGTIRQVTLTLIFLLTLLFLPFVGSYSIDYASIRNAVPSWNLCLVLIIYLRLHLNPLHILI